METNQKSGSKKVPKLVRIYLNIKIYMHVHIYYMCILYNTQEYVI